MELKKKSKVEESESSSNSSILGPIIAILFLGSVLFFFGDSFGNELVCKLVSSVLIFLGMSLLGAEISDSDVKNDGAIMMGFGSGTILLGLILDNAISGMPNIVTLLIITFGLAFVVDSIVNLAKTKHYKTKLLYRVIQIVGNVSSSIAGVVKLIQMFF